MPDKLSETYNNNMNNNILYSSWHMEHLCHDITILWYSRINKTPYYYNYLIFWWIIVIVGASQRRNCTITNPKLYRLYKLCVYCLYQWYLLTAQCREEWYNWYCYSAWLSDGMFIGVVWDQHIFSTAKISRRATHFLKADA